jgi:hypothetical protein
MNDTRIAAERLRCCGTCKWATPVGFIDKLSPPWDRSMSCDGPMPDAALSQDKRLMLPEEGDDCPCHETKEAT